MNKVAESLPPDYLNPDHYGGEGGPPPVRRDPPVQVIEIIDGLGLNWEQGNIVKYVTRYRRKGGMQDLHKARWMLDRLIKMVADEEATG